MATTLIRAERAQSSSAVVESGGRHRSVCRRMRLRGLVTRQPRCADETPGLALPMRSSGAEDGEGDKAADDARARGASKDVRNHGNGHASAEVEAKKERTE